MKKVVRLTESDLNKIIKRIISENMDFISDLNQYKYKSEKRSVDEIIDDEFNRFITDYGDLNPRAFETFEDFVYRIAIPLVVRPILMSFNFKGNINKKRKYEELLTEYIIKKYKEQLMEYFMK
jgi:hypothetical protein